MEFWDDLKLQLDVWPERRQTATFCWRDNDAVEFNHALHRLSTHSSNRGVPFVLVAIPGGIRDKTFAWVV